MYETLISELRSCSHDLTRFCDKLTKHDVRVEYELLIDALKGVQLSSTHRMMLSLTESDLVQGWKSSVLIRCAGTIRHVAREVGVLLGVDLIADRYQLLAAALARATEAVDTYQVDRYISTLSDEQVAFVENYFRCMSRSPSTRRRMKSLRAEAGDPPTTWAGVYFAAVRCGRLVAQ